MAGKLKGVIPATTPSGWRMSYTSIPVDACSVNRPATVSATPQAYSMFSSPRATSPAASGSVFPCSDEMTLASSAEFLSTSSRNLNISLTRAATEVARHSGNAAAAEAIAASISSTEAKSTWAVCCPVAGLNTGPVRPEVLGVLVPPMRW